MRRIVEVDGDVEGTLPQSIDLWACVLTVSNASLCESPKRLSEPPVHGNEFSVLYLSMDHVHAMNITDFALKKILDRTVLITA